MTRFKQGQRVIASNHADSDLHGYKGTVVRIRIADRGAWVQMDCDLPEHHQSFASDDSRYRHLLLYPADCEEL